MSLILLLFFTNLYLADKAFSLWETEPVPLASLKPYKTGIVLTGITLPAKSPEDRVYFGKGADRVLHTVQLYRRKLISKILISGGYGRISGVEISEAKQLQKVFINCGVPEKAIFIEPLSRNTSENALFSKKVLDSLNLSGENLLITSAFHMRRAKGCFDKAGIETDIFPVDYYVEDYFSIDKVIPSEKALYKWSILIHEILGYAVYKLMGYL